MHLEKPTSDAALDDEHGAPSRFTSLEQCAALMWGHMADLDWRLIFDAFADAVVATNGAGRILYVNEATEALLGWPAEELVDQPLLTLIPPRLHAEHEAGFARYRETRVPKLIGRPARVPALCRDGREIDVELILSAFHLGPEQELVVGLLRDRRDQVELERQLAVTRWLRATTAAAARLSGTLDRESLLRETVAVLAADFEAALARVWLYDEGMHTLCLRASAGLSTATQESSRARIDVATSPYKVGEVARTGRAFVRNGLAGDPQFDPEWVRREQIAAAAVFPLQVADERHGVLVYFARRPLPDELIETLAAFVAMVTAALQRARLFEREQEARAAAEAAQQRLAFLAEASNAFSASLDPPTTLAAVVRLAVPRLADWCAVDLIDETETLHRVAVEHVDPAMAERARELGRRYPPEPEATYGARKVVRTGAVDFFAEVSDPFLARIAQDDEHLRLLREVGVRSYLCVPLPARGRTLGAITLVRTQPGRSYTADDLLLAEDLARRAALAIDNAQFYRDSQEASEAKDRFLAVLSHELRTPLTPIQASVELLRRVADDPARVRRAAEVIDRSVRLQANLVNDLLDLSRVARGKLLLARRPVDLAELIGHTLDGLRSEVAAAGLTLAWEPPAVEIAAELDPFRTQQVLLNLVSNAIKFTPPGGRITVECRLSGVGYQGEPSSSALENGTGDRTDQTDRTDRTDTTPDPPAAWAPKHRTPLAAISVSDTGIGISPAALPLIFRMFHQEAAVGPAGSPRPGREVRPGLGIGLALVEALVRAQGGRVWAESDGLGRGSRFVVELPARQGSGVRGQGPAAVSLRDDPDFAGSDPRPLTPDPRLAGPAPRPLTPGDSPRVLLVEDNQDSREMLAEALTLLGYEVREAASAPEALAVLSGWRAEVILSDIGLPEIDGYALMRQIRQQPEHAGALALAVTGYGAAEDREKALAAGFNGHVTKPLDLDALDRELRGRLAASGAPGPSFEC